MSGARRRPDAPATPAAGDKLQSAAVPEPSAADGTGLPAMGGADGAGAPACGEAAAGNPLRAGLAAHLGPEVLDYLGSLRIGIAGAGGLGSNCAMHLVRSGLRRLVLVDHDVVEASNLNRQCYFAAQVGQPKALALAANLRAVAPDLELTPIRGRVDRDNAPALFAGCAAVVEALDDPRAKKALAEALLPGAALLVAASGIGGWGRAGDLAVRRVRRNFILVGDGRTPCDADHPPLSPTVGAAAAMQADALLAHFLELHQHDTARTGREDGHA
jgi:sulfur carrier protein ThiS adenylyltransferase